MEATGEVAGWKCQLRQDVGVKWRQRPVNDDRVLLDLVASDREKPRREVYHLTAHGNEPGQLWTHRALVDTTGLFSPEPGELLGDAELSGAELSARSSMNSCKIIKRATLRVPLISQSNCSPPTCSGALAPACAFTLAFC